MASLHRFMEVGLIHFMAYPEVMRGEGPILETLKNILTDDYFDAIEVTWMKDDLVRKKAKEMLAQSHMTVCYGAQPRLLTTGLNPNDLNEEGRLAAEKTLLEAIDEAEYLGAKGIAFLSGKWETAHRAEHYAQLVKTTATLCEYAAKKDMMVELEVFDYDLDKKSLIGPAPYAAQFAAEICCRYNNFGLLVDLSHLPQTYETPKFALRTMRPYISHLHIGSAVLEEGAVAFGDTHPRFGFPKGVNDVEDVAEFLEVCLDEGLLDPAEPPVLSFEVKPWEGEDPDIVIANAKRTLNRAWELLDTD